MQLLVNGARIHLECYSTRQNLRIKEDNHIDGRGGFEPSATFVVHNPGTGKIKLQTEGMSRRFIGILPNGQVVSCSDSKETELVALPSSTGGDMIFLANNWPASYYIGVNTNGHPLMCNQMTVGQFGGFTVKQAVTPVPSMPMPGMPVPIPMPGMPQPGMGHPHGFPHMIPGVPMPGHQVINTPDVHVVITPSHPSAVGGRSFASAKILAGRYGDFPTKRLVDVTQRLQSALDTTGKINLGSNYNAVFGDPAVGVLKGLLIVWALNDKFNSNEIHWGVVGENQTPVIDLSLPTIDHPVSQYPAGVYGDFGNGKFVDIRPTLAREFRFMSLNCPSYNGLFTDPSPGVRKALVVFYNSPCYKYMNISAEDELKTLDSNSHSNEVISSAFKR